MQAVKKDTSQLEFERDYWRKEAIIAQEMLAQILNHVGTVVLPKGRPLPENVGIMIDDDQERDAFVFRLATVDENGNEVVTAE